MRRRGSAVVVTKPPAVGEHKVTQLKPAGVRDAVDVNAHVVEDTFIVSRITLTLVVLLAKLLYFVRHVVVVRSVVVPSAVGVTREPFVHAVALRGLAHVLGATRNHLGNGTYGGGIVHVGEVDMRDLLGARICNVPTASTIVGCPLGSVPVRAGYTSQTGGLIL